MKNIGASVGAVPTPEQKAAEKKTVEEEEEEEEEEVETQEEEYHPMENEMIFCLNEAPEFRISAVGKWCENSAGKVIGDAETYFRHIMTGQRCESAWSCLTGWSESDERTMEKWEALCERIEELENLEQYICDEKRVDL